MFPNENTLKIFLDLLKFKKILLFKKYNSFFPYLTTLVYLYKNNNNIYGVFISI